MPCIWYSPESSQKCSMPGIAELPREVGGIPIRYEPLPVEPQFRNPHPRLQEGVLILPWNNRKERKEWENIFLLREGTQFLFFHTHTLCGYDTEGPYQETVNELWFGGMDTVPFLRQLPEKFLYIHPSDFRNRHEEWEKRFYSKLKPSHTVELEDAFNVTALRH